ncbi:MAG: hypothetical protein Kilf2KO_46300 [Rhodospirillales bacterium]
MTGTTPRGKLGPAGLLIASLLASSPLAAAADDWRLSTLLPEGSVQVQSLELFGQDLRAASKGRLSAAVYPRDSLPLPTELLPAVQSGAVEMAALPLTAFAAWGPLYETDSVATLAGDFASARRLWGDLRGPLQQDLWTRDLILLFAIPQAPRGLVGPSDLVDSSALQGLRLGASNALASAMARRLGAAPNVGAGDVLARSLRDGSLDAAFLSAPEALLALGSAGASTFYPFDSWIPLTLVVMHEGTFEALSRVEQEVLRQTAAEAEAQAWAAGEGQNAALLRMLQRDDLYQDSPGLRAALDEAGRAVAVDWLARAGAPGEALLRAYRN